MLHARVRNSSRVIEVRRSWLLRKLLDASVTSLVIYGGKPGERLLGSATVTAMRVTATLFRIFVHSSGVKLALFAMGPP